MLDEIRSELFKLHLIGIPTFTAKEKCKENR